MIMLAIKNSDYFVIFGRFCFINQGKFRTKIFARQPDETRNSSGAAKNYRRNSELSFRLSRKNKRGQTGVKAIKTLIVDDEPLARKRIKQLLANEPDIEVIGECGDGKSALAALRDLQPDLVFLDVEMPGATGVEVLEKSEPDASPAVIFVTAYDEYTIKAFDFHAVDYLLKPYSEDRFREAVRRAKLQIGQKNKRVLTERFADLFDYLKLNRNHLERLIVGANNRLVALAVDEIDWIEAYGNYLKIHYKGKSFLLRETLNDLSAKLDSRKFVRIHRSTLVNLNRIKEFQPMFGGQYTVVLRDGTELTLSRSYREKVMSRFGQ